MKTTREVALATLKPVLALGKTPKDMARRLKQLRCRGERNSTDNCPLANYLGRVYGVTQNEVHVGYEHISVDGIMILAKYVRAKVFTFIGRFDDGKYPELVQ